jgi:hypothetical protein
VKPQRNFKLNKNCIIAIVVIISKDGKMEICSSDYSCLKMTRAVSATTFSIMTLDIAIKTRLRMMPFGVKILTITTACIVTLDAECP